MWKGSEADQGGDDEQACWQQEEVGGHTEATMGFKNRFPCFTLSENEVWLLDAY